MNAKAILIAGLLAAGAGAQTQPEQQTERALNLSRVDTAAARQEMVNLLRTLDAPIAFTNSDLTSVTLRGTAGQAAVAEWLADEVGGHAGRPVPTERHVTSVYDNAEPARSGSAVRVFYPAGVKTPDDLQELVNLIRTATDLQRVYPFPPAFAIAARGTPVQQAAVEWLIRSLEPEASGQPVTATKMELLEPRGQNASPELRVLRSSIFTSPARVQEAVNALRTVADIQRMFQYNRANAIALRGTAGQAALAEWMLGAMDKRAGALPPAVTPKPEAFSYPDERRGETDVRLFFPARIQAGAALMEATNAIRVITDVQRMFPVSSSMASLAARGTPSQIALTEWLLGELDRGRSGQDVARYAYAGSEQVRVFWMPRTAASDAANELARGIRSLTNAQRVFYAPRSGALVMRGTDEQAAQAEGLVKEMTVAAR